MGERHGWVVVRATLLAVVFSALPFAVRTKSENPVRLPAFEINEGCAHTREGCVFMIGEVCEHDGQTVYNHYAR